MNDWTALTVTTTTEAIEAVSNILMEAGAVGIQIKDAADFKKEPWMLTVPGLTRKRCRIWPPEHK
ncbi:ribosomal protein L11 methyltransferase [Lacticaseibacillus paracasei subsp. paracasei Lpp48]|nr:ribosomal protein L11 methyltransferase [Lacticaseibacillus paracasei subsp. paracasei Lpp48]